jgi:hypothetical protein
MAIDAVYSWDVKTHKGLRFMAVGAIGSSVGAKQWKPAHLVDFSDIVYQPRSRSMTSAAIKSGCSLVNICMTFIAFGFSFRKDKGGMALPAVNYSMLTGESKLSPVMVK